MNLKSMNRAKMAQFSWFISMIIDRDFSHESHLHNLCWGTPCPLFSYSIFYTFLESAVRAAIENVVVPL